MCTRHIFLCVVVVVVIGNTIAKVNNTNTRADPKKKTNFKNEVNVLRIKRAANDDDENPFWSARGKKPISMTQYRDELNSIKKEHNSKIDNEPPFWGMRGRRDSESLENDHHETPLDSRHFGLNCKHCYTSARDIKEVDYDYTKDNEYDKLNSKKNEDNNNYLPEFSWKTRRQENDPFWGARGRRQEDTPFWGQRGRREDMPFWGPRGRRYDEDYPFWSSRGRRDVEADNEPFWGNRGRRDDEFEPFWGNRGRREENFGGNKGKLQENDPFWGTRGRRRSFEPFHGKQKQDLKHSLQEAIHKVEENIENLARFQREHEIIPNAFWFNRGKFNQLKNLLNDARLKYQGLSPKMDSQATMMDDRILVEEPHYIVVERTDRSSEEDSPFFTSRGKKKHINFELVKAARDRRGAIEEIVKSMRNDPFYIARGKKDTDMPKAGNITILREQLAKAKDLICATIDLITIKKEGAMTKREINDSERDRRTILKKLAAQLQIDPYFVSRGKKNGNGVVVNDDILEEFINDVAEKCN